MNETVSVYKNMSQSEREVADYLDKLDIMWKYEYPVFLSDEKERPRLWTPDFYLPELNIYIEVCGAKEFDYEYRKKRYYDNNITVVFLHLYDLKIKWQIHFRERLMVYIKENLETLNKMMGLVLR